MIKIQKKHVQLLLKGLLLIGILVGISLLSLLILSAFGIVSYNDGLQLNMRLFDAFINAWYGWIIVILVQILFTSLLSVIPGISMAFILLLKSIYAKAWQAFLVAFLGVMITSFFLYVLGRFGGYAICKKLLGEEDCEKALNLLNKGSFFFPVMMMFPVFPDDALVMIAGTMKMKLAWFVPSIVLGRGIGIATIVFGLSLVPFDQFTSIWHWVLFIAICAVFIALVFFLAFRLNKYLENKKKVGEEVAEKESEDIAEVAEMAEVAEIAQAVEEN